MAIIRLTAFLILIKITLPYSTTCFKMKTPAFCPQDVFFLAILISNSDYLSKLHQQPGLYNGEAVCFLCGRNGICYDHLEDWLVAGLRDRVNTGPVHVGFVVDSVAHEKGFVLVIRGFPVVIIP
jgi:hypothetical protein